MLLARALLCLSLAVPASALPELPGTPALRVYGEKEGLPNPTVQAIVRDPKGRLWVATQDGVATFDGRQWRTLNLPREAKSNYVRTLLFDGRGDLWVGTQDDGLWILRGGAWERLDLPTVPPRPRINGLTRTVAQDGTESVWICTGGAGLLRWSAQGWTQLDRRRGLPSDWVWSLREGREGAWVATDGGVVRLGAEGMRAFTEGEGLPGKACNECLETAGPGGGRRVWAACWGRGLGLHEHGAWRPVPFPSRYPVSLAEARTEEGEPILWVGTNDMGLLWRVGEGPWRTLGPDQGLPGRGVYGLLATGSRPQLWMGLREGGCRSLDLGGFYAHPSPPAMGDPKINTFLETKGPEGPPTLWLGTESGLEAWREGRRLPLTPPNPRFPKAQITCLAHSAAFGGSRVVVGTMEGLAVQEGGAWRWIRGPELPDPDVRALLAGREEDGAEALWVAGNRGLAHFARGRWTRWGAGEGPPHPMVYALLETREREGPSLWVGTRGGGVGRLRGGRWTSYGLESGLPNLSVYALLESRAPDGTAFLLAGTFGGGLAWIEKDRPGAAWHVLSTQENPGLPSNVILSLAEDPGGRIYLGTPRGLVRALPPWRGGSWRVEVFTEQDGLPSRACARLGLQVDAAGILRVATRGGLAWFDTVHEPSLPPLPRPLLERVVAAGREVGPARTRALPFDQQPLQVDFSLPYFLNPEAVQFRTRMVGLEERPTAWGPEGRRFLGFLPRGTYVLRVEARDSRGRLSEPLDLDLRVYPPPWAAPWALALYGALAAGGGWMLLRLRTSLLRARAEQLQQRVDQATREVRTQKADLERLNQRLEHLNQEKNRMLGIAAHDLRNPLNGIRLYAQMLREDPGDAAEAADLAGRIEQGADHMGELIRRLLDVSHIESGTLALHPQALDPTELASRLLEIHDHRAREKGIRLCLEAPPSLPPLWADPMCLREVLDNLLSNALKFTPPGPPPREVRVRLEAGLVEVRDQGPGFSEEDRAGLFGRFTRLSARPTSGESSTGLGLSIVKALVEAMDGSITLDSRPGEGAAFQVRLPLAKGPVA